MSYFTHSQRRGTLFAPLGSVVLVALLFVLPFAPAAHSQGDLVRSRVTQSECNSELGNVTWDSASNRCIFLGSLIILVADGVDLDDAETQLEARSGWTAAKKELVKALLASNSSITTLSALKTERDYFKGQSWAKIVELDAIVWITSLVPSDGPINSDGSVQGSIDGDGSTGAPVGGSIGGDGSKGTAAFASPLAFALASPQDLTVVAGNGQLSLDWAAPADNADITGYHVQWKADDEDYDAETRQFTSSGTNTAITGLTNEVEYLVRVRATQKTSNKHSDWTDEQQAMPSLAPSAPEGLTVVAGAEHLYVHWTAPTYVAGHELRYYQIEYQRADSQTDTWVGIYRIPANRIKYRYRLGGLTNDALYNVRVRAINKNPEWVLAQGAWADATGTPTPIEVVGTPTPTEAAAKPTAAGPSAFALADNYPNPFNPATTIGYVLPTAADVRLEVFNLAGQHITTLVSAYQLAGRHTVEWDATNAQGQAVASGVYFYRLQAAPSTALDEFGAVKRMLLIR